MKKTAVIFPGQGSQYIGMGQAFIEHDRDALALMERAEQISAFPLRRLSLEGPLDELTRVLHLQPALTAMNLICWQQLKKRLPDFAPVFAAGHSLGEYSALHVAGVLSLDDTLSLVTKRGELMEREGCSNPGGMRAVLGLTLAQVEEVLAQYTGPGVMVVANHNTAAQVVLSGDQQGLDYASERCTALGGKIMPLKVSVANHSPLVAGAVEDFAACMAAITFKKPTLPVLFNATGGYENDPAIIKGIMARQIASRVRWLEIVERMAAEGVEAIVELGPKSVLTGMMKKILAKDTAILCLQADTPESMDKAAGLLSA